MVMAPKDQSVVLAKMGDGTIVSCIFNGTFSVGTTEEGQEILVTPNGPMVADRDNRLSPRALDSSVRRYDAVVEEAAALRLKPGCAQEFVYWWVNQLPKRMSEVRVDRWVPVSRKANEVYCPYAYGDKTDDFWHYGDMILHKRDAEYDRQVNDDMRAYNNPTKYLAAKAMEIEETGARLGMKDVTTTIERADADALTIGEAGTQE